MERLDFHFQLSNISRLPIGAMSRPQTPVACCQTKLSQKAVGIKHVVHGVK